MLQSCGGTIVFPMDRHWDRISSRAFDADDGKAFHAEVLQWAEIEQYFGITLEDLSLTDELDK